MLGKLPSVAQTGIIFRKKAVNGFAAEFIEVVLFVDLNNLNVVPCP